MRPLEDASVLCGGRGFGKPFGYLAAEGDVDDSIKLIRDRFIHWGQWISLPKLERLIYRNPITIRQKRKPSSMVAVATTRLEARLRDEKDVVDSEHSDLLSKFLASAKDQPQTLTTAGITGLLMSITSGSVDTIATTVTAALYRLMKSPSSFDRLRKELVDLPEIPDFADDKKLSCLDAVIKETMRLV